MPRRSAWPLILPGADLGRILGAERRTPRPFASAGLRPHRRHAVRRLSELAADCAPAELTSGIVIFEHSNYLGASAHVTEELKNLEDVKEPCIKTETSPSGTSSSKDVWGDCISSIRLIRL
jgi:hypothetical protein